MATPGEVRSSDGDDSLVSRADPPKSPPGRGRRRRRRRHRGLKITAGVIVVLFLVWVVGGYFVLAKPRIDAVRKVDAVVVLGPADQQQRWLTGLRLAKAGYAGTLVVSMNAEQRANGFAPLCDAKRTFKIICFLPDPATTRGEAQETARLAAQNHWRSVIVVTSTYHITRARMIFDRCNAINVLMRPASGSVSVGHWAYEYLYQTVAFAKVFVTSRC